MTTIKVKSNLAYLSEKDTYTKGQVGKVIYLYFSTEWSDLLKTVVFNAGDRYKSNFIVSDPDSTGAYAVEIPWEILTQVGKMLRVGVYGSNSNKVKVIPTIWVELGYIRDAADVSNNIEPTPEFIQQVLGLVEQAVTYRDETRRYASEIEDMTVTGELLPSESDFIVTKSIIDDVVNLDFKIPRGLTGTSITNITSEISPDDGGTNVLYIHMSNGTTYSVYFKNGSKGRQGDQGVSITSIDLLYGDHSPGTMDTYRISMSNGKYYDFEVWNGRDSDITVNGKSPDPNGNIEITREDLGAAAASDIPTKLSDLTNDLKSITFRNKSYNGSEDVEIGVSDIHHAVPDWRKVNGYRLESNIELSYADVGADYNGAARDAVINHNDSNKAHSELFDAKADLVNGKIPYSEIPDISSYEEYPRSEDFPVSGDPHIFYVATNTSRLYRWIVSEGRYRETSYTLSLGTGHNTAFYGDWGKIAYDHAMITDGNPHGTTAHDLGLADVATTGDYNDLINKPDGLLPYAVIPNPDSEEGSAGVSDRFARGDHSHPIVKEIVMGYFNKVDKKFYLHKNGSVYTDEIAPDERWMYVDVDENIGYRWAGNKYVTIASKIDLSVEGHILNITV